MASHTKDKIAPKYTYDFMLCGLLNHWDGTRYQLAPAYDICPMFRTGLTSGQAMIVGKQGRLSILKNALSEEGLFGITQEDAKTIQKELVDNITTSKLSQKCKIAIITGIEVLISNLNRNHVWDGLDSWFKAGILNFYPKARSTIN